MKRLQTSLRELGLSENEVKVYLALTKLGEAKASVVAKRSGLSRTTVIGILSRLENGGFVTTHKYRGTVYYWVESPGVLKSSYENKIAVVGDIEHLLSDLYHSENALPFVKVCDTKESVRAQIEREIAALPKGAKVRTIDSPHVGNYQKVFSDEYYYALLALKKKRGVVTETLVPFGTMGVIEKGKLDRQSIILREMPESVHFLASLWLMGDRLYLFSGTPPFLVVIKQEAVVKSLSSIYSFLWSVSTDPLTK